MNECNVGSWTGSWNMSGKWVKPNAIWSLVSCNILEKTLMLGKIEGRRRRGWQRTRWLDGITDSIDSVEFEQALGDGEAQGSLVCHSPQDAESWTLVSNWTATAIRLCWFPNFDICIVVMWDVTIRGICVRGIQLFSVLYLKLFLEI